MSLGHALILLIVPILVGYVVVRVVDLRPSEWVELLSMLVKVIAISLAIVGFCLAVYLLWRMTA